MLRVDILESPDTWNLRLEGRFTGEDAEQTRMLMTRYRAGMPIVIDLADVVFIDDVGEEVLSFFARFGAVFVAATSYTLDVCERLHLRVAPAGNSHANTPGRSSTNNGQSRAEPPDPQTKAF